MAIKIRKGSTHKIQLRFEQKSVRYVAVSGVTSAAPVVITATGHEMPDGWRCAFSAIKGGPAALNAAHKPPRDKEYFKGKVIDANTIELNSVNGKEWSAYTAASGILQFNLPVDLTNCTVMMQIRELVDSPLYLVQKIETDMEIVEEDGFIEIELDPADTADLDVDSAVFDVVVTLGNGDVIYYPKTDIIFIPPVTHAD